MDIKGNKGVTLIALTLTVILLMVITSAMIFGTKNNISIKRIQNLRIDIEMLNSKIDDYYLKYGGLPVLCEYVNGKEEFKKIIENRRDEAKAYLSSEINENDGDKYVVIDLEKLGGVTLNYGYDNDDYKKLNDIRVTSNPIEDEIYVINTTTHQIYFPHGVFADNTMYYMF